MRFQLKGPLQLFSFGRLILILWVLKWASTWVNQIMGSAAQNGRMLMLTAATVEFSVAVVSSRGGLDISNAC